jgi:NADPH:quinone reductase-like Zn-dependent oxidoreductase
MRAMRLSDAAQAPALIEDDAPRPQPQRGEILVRVHAAGVTPTEIAWIPTIQTRDGAKRSRVIPGHEFSGVVAAVGDDVTGMEIGQEVYGMNDWYSDGAFAEYCIAQPNSVAPKPPRLSHVEAASVPIGALTAWQGLFERARLQRGERVLVQGGAGAVGVFAIQLAHWRGARVTTTASARNLDFVAAIGAERAIDYRAEPFERDVTGMDVVFDTVGGDTLERSWDLLQRGGRMVTIAVESETASEDRVKQAFFIVEPSHDQLVRVGELLESGELEPVVDAVVPLDQAGAALTKEMAGSRGRGKRVVTIGPES